jgi:hypothetical protein
LQYLLRAGLVEQIIPHCHAGASAELGSAELGSTSKLFGPGHWQNRRSRLCWRLQLYGDVGRRLSTPRFFRAPAISAFPDFHLLVVLRRPGINVVRNARTKTVPSDNPCLATRLAVRIVDGHGNSQFLPPRFGG